MLCQCRRYLLHDHLLGHRAHDDHSWSRAVLRRHGQGEERTCHRHASFLHRMHHHRHVLLLRLLPGLRSAQPSRLRSHRQRTQLPLLRRRLSVLALGGEPGHLQLPSVHHPRERLRLLPAHLRHHHRSPHLRLVRRPHEVRPDAYLHESLAHR